MNSSKLDNHGEKTMIVYGQISSQIRQSIESLQTQYQDSFHLFLDINEIKALKNIHDFDLLLAYEPQATFDKKLFSLDIPIICLLDEAQPSEVTRLIHQGAFAVVEADNVSHLKNLIHHNDEYTLPCKPESCIYHEILNELPLLVCRFDSEFNLTFVNQAYAQWRQCPEHELIGTNFLSRIPNDELKRVKHHIASLTPDSPIKTSAHRSLQDDGSTQWIEWTDRALFDTEGNLTEYQSVGRDMTIQMEVKQRLTSTEKELHTKESQLALILDTMQDGLISIALDPREVIYVSASFEDVFGYPYERFVNEPDFFKEVTHPDDLELGLEAQKRCLLEGFVEFEHRLIMPDGSIRWILRRVWVNYDKNGKPIRINDSGRDITEQKIAQNLLRESEELYRLTLSNISDAVFMTNDQGDFTFVCPNVDTLLGLSTEEVMQIGNISGILKDVIFDIDILKKRGEITNIERRVVNKSGAIFDVLVNVKSIDIRNSRVLYTVHDITERKKAELELRESEARFEAFMENLPGTVFIEDRDHRLVYANTAYGVSLGKNRDNLIGRSISDYKPDLLNIVEYEDQEILRDMKAHEFAFVDDRDTNKPRYWQIHKFPIAQENHNVLIGAIGMDITEKVMFQNSLTESERRYRQMFEFIKLPKMIVDPKTLRIMDVNPESISFYGYELEQFKSMTMLDLCDSEYPELEGKLNKVVQGEVDRCKLVHLLADGSRRDMEMYVGAIDGEDERALYCVFIDVSERNRAREALEEANQNLERRVAERTAQLEQVNNQLEAIFNNSGDGIVLLDDENTIQKANEACTKLFGVDSTKDITANLTDFIHADDRDIVTACLSEIRQSHTVQRVDVRLNGTNGGVEAEMSLSPILGSDTKQLSRNFVGIIRDVTERKKAQKALSNSEQLLRTIAENHPSYLAIVDKDFIVRFASGHQFYLRGLDTDAYIGQHLKDLLQDKAEYIYQQLEGAFNGEELAFEVEVDTEYHYYRAVPLDQDNGSVNRILLSIENITQRKQAEIKIAEERNLLRTIIDSVPEFIYVKDTEHKMLLNNRAHLEAIGTHSQDEVIGKTDFELFPYELASKFYADDRKVFEQKSALTTEEQAQSANGTIIWGLTTKVPFLNLDGELIGVVGITHDITERKITEIAIKESESRYRLLAENVNDMITRHTPDGRYLYATPSSINMTGYTPAEIVGKTIYDFIYEEDIPDVQMSHDTVLTVPDVYTVRYRFVQKDGTLRWVETNSHSIRNIADQVIEIIAVTRDITDRIRAENEMKAISDRLQLATNAAGIGVWEWVVESGELIWDEQMCHLYGVLPEQFGGEFEDWRTKVHADDLEASKDALFESVAENKPFYSQFRIIKPDGSIRHILALANTYCEGHEDVQRLIGVNMDISDLKQAESALRNALKAEQDVSELKSRIVSVASHEFRTPLTAILAITETLTRFRDRMEDEQIADRLEKIAYQVQHMKGITEDMLQFTRLQSQEYQLNLVFSDMSVFCREIIEEFNSQPDYENRVTFVSKPEHIMCRYDEKLMRQAVSNLIHNALKYSQEEVELSIAMNTSKLVINVKDQGIGVPESNLKHLFDPFYRANNVGSISGTGLGLSVTKHAIQAHGGDVTVRSEVGGGSIFTITLPLSTTGVKSNHGKDSGN